MPGFNTLGARLARSRRRLERERAEVKSERLAPEGRNSAIPGEGTAAAATAGMSVSAQVIRFPRLNRRIGD